MKVLSVLKEYLMITIGLIIAAVGIYFFLVPSGVTVGSISGLGLVLEKIFSFKLSTITFVLYAAPLIV